MSRGKRPKITWGAGFANTLTFGPIPDDMINYPLPREGSEWYKGTSGIEEAWVLGTEHHLELRVRYIPIADQVAPWPATGWDGAAGWSAFLTWARDKNVFRFYPDAAAGVYLPCYLVEPMTDKAVGLEKGHRHRWLVLRIRTSDDSAFTGY